jgi:hypothetical protein
VLLPRREFNKAVKRLVSRQATTDAPDPTKEV